MINIGYWGPIPYQNPYCSISFHDLREIKLEVELPCRALGWRVAMLVHEGDADLDDLEQVHITPQQLVLVVGRAAKLTDGPRYHTGELRVLEAKRGFSVQSCYHGLCGMHIYIRLKSSPT